MTTRPASAAGTLYEKDTHRLLAQVEAWLEEKPTISSEYQNVKAIIAPHSGFFASGETAAAAYKELIPQYDKVKRVVLIGTAHHDKIDYIAVPSCQNFLTPLGKVEVDQEQLTKLLTLEQVVENDEQHSLEHSIELQLPFIQTLLDDFKLIPMITSQCDFNLVAEALEAVWGGPETLIVISSGLSRHLDLQQAMTQDIQTAKQIMTLDSSVEETNACGFSAINALLDTAKKHQLIPNQLALTTSATATGKTERVRGFGAFVFTSPVG